MMRREFVHRHKGFKLLFYIGKKQNNTRMSKILGLSKSFSTVIEPKFFVRVEVVVRCGHCGSLINYSYPEFKYIR